MQLAEIRRKLFMFYFIRIEKKIRNGNRRFCVLFDEANFAESFDCLCSVEFIEISFLDLIHSFYTTILTHGHLFFGWI